MYHIKQDKRSQVSAAQIVQGLQECLKTKPLKSITFSDLHRTTGISRATIYRLFDTPEDVLLYQLDQMTENALESYQLGEELTSAELMEETMRLGLENHDFLRALVENGRLDLLFQYTEKSFRNMNNIKSVFPKDMLEGEREYVIAHLAMSIVASQITWDRNGQQETAKDLIGYMKRYIRLLTELLGDA